MNNTEASLSIELNVECPKCADYIDILRLDNHNDEGQVLQEACPSKGHWSDSHAKFVLDIECPQCGEEFTVNGIGW